jgi:hypothetical protein
MPKDVRLASTMPATYITARPISTDYDYGQLTPIALFSGIGLLVSLIAVLAGVQGSWF